MHKLYFEFDQIICPCGKRHALTTTDTGHCLCGGWRLWAKTREEIISGFEQHLRFHEQPTPPPPAEVFRANVPAITLHQLRWNGSIAVCSGCDWHLYGLPTEEIQRCHAAHQRTVGRQ